jgi:hypothetical protein
VGNGAEKGGGGGEKAGGPSEKAAAARDVSVRRLAAGVWRLRPPEAVAGGAAAGSGERRRVHVGLEVRARRLKPFPLFRF